MNLKLLLLISATILVCCRCSDGTRLQKRVSDLLHTEIITRGDLALTQEPVTITSFVAERSAGGVHDFYSEGDYWWPDPVNPDSAYIRRDGETNPDNFVAHRHAMIRFSSIVGDLTSAWIVTKDEKYIVQALKHIRAWFIDPETRMNPDLQYAQAIKGIVTGRGIGIIDTIHLLEVVQSLIVMEQAGLLSNEDAVATKDWFSNYLYWLTNHPYGKDEMNAKNNHGTCWVMQAAQFAKYTGKERCWTSAANVIKQFCYRDRWIRMAVFRWNWREPNRTDILSSIWMLWQQCAISFPMIQIISGNIQRKTDGICRKGWPGCAPI